MTSDDDRLPYPWLDLPGADEIFDPAAATEDGWRVPVAGQPTSYLYFGRSDFAFEIWLGGDNDLNVRIERDFTLREGKRSHYLDPRSTRKSDLAPALDIGSLRVAEMLVTRSERLEIKFKDDWELTVDPSADARAWSIDWPGGLYSASGPSTYPSPVDPLPEPRPAPLPQDGDESPLALPIRGLVTEGYASSDTIGLMLPIASGGQFDIHLGGEVRITGGEAREWTGRAHGAAVLDLIGASVVGAHMDETERLHLEFGDGRVLVAGPDHWAATWPALDGSYEDVWVPREDPYPG